MLCHLSDFFKMLLDYPNNLVTVTDRLSLTKIVGKGFVSDQDRKHGHRPTDVVDDPSVN
jgi:hypothetical protein